MASSITHSWDLPSLLIKPVQQLLNYPLLLGAIIEQTPDSHGDKENLKSAMEKMEGVVRGINEGRKRIEIMKEVLAGRTDTGNASGVKKKMSTNKSAFVILERMKSISVGMRIHRPKEDDEAVAKVEAYEKKLRDWDPFVREFARDICRVGCVRQEVDRAPSRMGDMLCADDRHQRRNALRGILRILGRPRHAFESPLRRAR